MGRIKQRHWATLGCIENYVNIIELGITTPPGAQEDQKSQNVEDLIIYINNA